MSTRQLLYGSPKTKAMHPTRHWILVGHTRGNALSAFKARTATIWLTATAISMTAPYYRVVFFSTAGRLENAVRKGGVITITPHAHSPRARTQNVSTQFERYT